MQHADDPSGNEMLKSQRMDVKKRIETNLAVMQGKPVVRGTRIPVELLLRKLAEGAQPTELLDAYPRLTDDDIRACLAYAAETIAHESVYPLDIK